VHYQVSRAPLVKRTARLEYKISPAALMIPDVQLKGEIRVKDNADQPGSRRDRWSLKLYLVLEHLQFDARSAHAL
jgi:hypothetical protein